MLGKDYDIEKARLTNLTAFTSSQDDQAVPSTPSSVVEYVLNGHLINTGTEGPTKPVGPKGLTFLRTYSIQVALLQVLQMSFKFNFFF